MSRKRKKITPEMIERRRRTTHLFIIFVRGRRDGLLPLAGAALAAMECVEQGSQRRARLALRLKPDQEALLLAAGSEFRSASFDVRRTMILALVAGYFREHGEKPDQEMTQELYALLCNEHAAICVKDSGAKTIGQETIEANGWSDERRAKQSVEIQTWRPWEKSTGPKTPEGKARSALNSLLREP